jgi:hypothetical protein
LVRAQWQVEEVHEQVTGLLMVGWLMEPDPERGGWRLTPGLIDVRIRSVASGTTGAGAPSTGTSCPSSDPHLE